jgi:hypothetical protein
MLKNNGLEWRIDADYQEFPGRLLCHGPLFGSARKKFPSRAAFESPAASILSAAGAAKPGVTTGDIQPRFLAPRIGPAASAA